jgi:hypothetical protein
VTLPGTYALALYRGDSYAWLFRLWTDPGKTDPADLTGVQAKAEVRDNPGGSAIMELVCTIEAPNIVHVDLPADSWTAWPLLKGVWDLQLTYPTGEVVTIVSGPVSVTADVTDSPTAAVAGYRQLVRR